MHRLLADQILKRVKCDQPEIDGHVDLVEHDHVMVSGPQGLGKSLKAEVGLVDVDGFTGPAVEKNSTSELPDLDRQPGCPQSPYFTGIAAALHELKDQHPHSVAGGPQGGSQSGGRFAFALAGVDDDKPLWRHRVVHLSRRGPGKTLGRKFDQNIM